MTKNLMPLLGVCGLMLASAGVQAGTSDSTPAGTSTATPVAKAPAASATSLHRTEQQLEQHRAELQQLQQEVAQQESRGKATAARQQQQDQTIAQLQQQLQALHAGSNPPVSGH